MSLIAGGLLQQLRTDEEFEPAALERDVAPVVDGKIDHGEPAGRQVVGQRLASGLVAVRGQAERQFMQAGIVADDQQAARILRRSAWTMPQDIAGIGQCRVRPDAPLARVA